MAEAGPSTRASSVTVSKHENNIGMLFEKLKELRMDAENFTHASVYGKIESKCDKNHILNELYDYFHVNHYSDRFAAERS